MCRMTNSFFSLPLRTGAIIVGWISLIVLRSQRIDESVTSINYNWVSGTILLGYALMRLVGFPGPGNVSSNRLALIVAAVLTTLVFITNIIVCTCLLIGAYKSIPQLVIPFLVFAPVKFFIILLFFIFAIIWIDTWNSVIAIISLPMLVYFMMVVCSFYNHLMKQARRSTTTSVENTGQSYAGSHSAADNAHDHEKCPQQYQTEYPQQCQTEYPQQYQTEYPQQYQREYLQQYQTEYPQQCQTEYQQQYQQAYERQYQKAYEQYRSAYGQQQYQQYHNEFLQHQNTYPQQSLEEYQQQNPQHVSEHHTPEVPILESYSTPQLPRRGKYLLRCPPQYRSLSKYGLTNVSGMRL